jgi:RimJ/RimL family protein N-acetyltransferase
MNHMPFFESSHLRLTPIDPEKDTQTMAAWTYDLDIAARLREEHPARPLAGFELKKLTERWQKESEENNRQYFYAIRLGAQTRDENAMIGILRIKNIEWVHGAAFLDLIFADPEDWQCYAREALDLALHYAFDELNLFRVTAVIAEHNLHANNLFEQANFTLEVRQREAIYWNKRSWDKLFFGLLRPEWKMQQLAEVEA